jgi:formate transporter
LGNILGIGIFVSILYLADGFGGGSPDNNIITKVYNDFGLHKMYRVGDKLGAGKLVTGNNI